MKICAEWWMIWNISKFDTSINGLLSSTEDVSKMPKKIGDIFWKSTRPTIYTQDTNRLHVINYDKKTTYFRSLILKNLKYLKQVCFEWSFAIWVFLSHFPFFNWKFPSLLLSIGNNLNLANLDQLQIKEFRVKIDGSSGRLRKM